MRQQLRSSRVLPAPRQKMTIGGWLPIDATGAGLLPIDRPLGCWQLYALYTVLLLGHLAIYRKNLMLLTPQDTRYAVFFKSLRRRRDCSQDAVDAFLDLIEAEKRCCAIGSCT